MTAPVRRVSVPSAVGENRERIRILEAVVPGVGDYVFLAEYNHSGGGIYFDVDNIDQGYTHLVVELAVAAVWGSTVKAGYPSSPVDLLVTINRTSGPYGQTPQFWWDGAPNPSTPIAEEPTGWDSPVSLERILTFNDLVWNGSDFSAPNPQTVVTIKFPFYTRGAAGYMLSGLWSAVSYVPVAAPNSVQGANGSGAYSTGGLFVEEAVDSIDSIRFFAGKVPFLVARGAWSAITAYVVGDRVTSGGNPYVCVANNTNQVPPNAAFWVKEQPDLATITTATLYGIKPVP